MPPVLRVSAAQFSVLSQSHPEIGYHTVTNWRGRWRCDNWCESYRKRRRCSHVDEAVRQARKERV